MRHSEIGIAVHGVDLDITFASRGGQAVLISGSAGAGSL